MIESFRARNATSGMLVTREEGRTVGAKKFWLCLLGKVTVWPSTRVPNITESEGSEAE